MKKILTVLFLAALGASTGCGGTECGTGTTEVDGACIAGMAGGFTCGANTTAMGGACVGNFSCGSGTTASAGGVCVSNDGLSCGANTTETNNVCVGATPIVCAAGTMLMNGMCVLSDGEFRQIEQLARPGINEVLIIGDGFHTGYNATAPTFAGVPPATLTAVVAEVKTVLKALYLGGCLLNGALGLAAADGVKPAGITCHAVGPALWTENTLAGVTLTAASQMAAQTYADAVFGLFIPDVMRVDTAIDSNYETLCGAGASQGLCGGRFVREDVIDTTYDFLLNGAQLCTTPANCVAPNQFNALLSDGVAFDNEDPANNRNTRVVGDPTNRQQGHPNVSNMFPYSAPPQ